MSNTLAIATVTATLQHLIQMYITTDLSAAIVKIGQPTPPPVSDPVPAVNISLYQVTPNLAYRNADLPARDSAGRLFTKPRLGLDLHYLISFYGDEQQLEPQRLLGRVAQILHGQPVLTSSLIRQAIDAMKDNTYQFLANSNLDQELIEQIKFIPQSVTFEELARLWSTFFNTIPYSLSAVYMASVVLIDGMDDTMKQIPKVGQNPIINLVKTPPIHKAHTVTFIDTNTTAGYISGTVIIDKAADETDLTSYAIYWGISATDKMLSKEPIAVINKTGAQLNYALNNLLKPLTATHLLVFTRNGYAEMNQGISVKINDITST